MRTIVTLLLLTTVAVAQQVRERALPFASKGGCPAGYYLSGSYCAPLNRDSKPAVPRPPGASCPSGWYSSGGGCVRLNR